MKKIHKDEIYQNIGTFLKQRGIELNDGSYTSTIRNCCSFLTDTINLSQQGITKVGEEVTRAMDEMRSRIHEATAPTKAGATPPPPTGSKASQPKERAKASKPGSARKAESGPKTGARKKGPKAGR